MSVREIIAENLAALFESSETIKSPPALERATSIRGKDFKVGKSTIDRALKKKANLTIDNIESIAKAFGLDAWQMLTPSLDPSNPPVLRSIGAVEEKLYSRIKDLAKQIAETDPK